jgi:transcriptional regulator with XRE-family HTH domain
MPLVLDKAELKNRIDALRTLRGLTQVDLAELFAAKGHGTQELGRLERGALPLTDIRKRTLAEILDVPERFFEEEHLDLTDVADDVPHTQLDRLERTLAEIMRREERAQADRDAITALLAQQSGILSQISDLLVRQESILLEMQRVASGLPADDTLRVLNERTRELLRTEAVDPAELPGATLPEVAPPPADRSGLERRSSPGTGDRRRAV